MVRSVLALHTGLRFSSKYATSCQVYFRKCKRSRICQTDFSFRVSANWSLIALPVVVRWTHAVRSALDQSSALICADEYIHNPHTSLKHLSSSPSCWRFSTRILALLLMSHSIAALDGPESDTINGTFQLSTKKLLIRLTWDIHIEYTVYKYTWVILVLSWYNFIYQLQFHDLFSTPYTSSLICWNWVVGPCN